MNFKKGDIVYYDEMGFIAGYQIVNLNSEKLKLKLLNKNVYKKSIKSIKYNFVKDDFYTGWENIFDNDKCTINMTNNNIKTIIININDSKINKYSNQIFN